MNFNEYKVDELVHFNTVQKLYFFPNGRGASVVIGNNTYGNSQGLYEIAVLFCYGEEKELYGIDYTTPLTDDVIGYVPYEDIDIWLEKIYNLPPMG